MQSGDLAASHVWTFEVGVKQEVEVEGDVLARVVDSDVLVQFFFTENQSVGNPKRAVPHRPCEFVVGQAEDGLDVAGVKAIRTLKNL